MISGLHHYALEVPDLEVAEGFLQDFGLETAERTGRWSLGVPAVTRSRCGSSRRRPAPQRLGHSLLFTARPQQMTDFYTQVLGLRVSDTIHGLVTFLNAGAGDHHVFGFIASTHRGFHHASFEVPSIDAIAVGADRMRAKGRDAGWGIGRHTIGSNFFHYSPDPWGSWIEWFSDIDQIDDCWVANDWDVPPHLWGAPPPETFLTNREPQS